MTESERFKRWLAGETKRNDAMGEVARRAVAGRVRFNGEDDSATRAVLTDARIEWRAADSNRRKSSVHRAPKKGKVSTAPIKGVSVSARCAGCGKTATETGGRTLRVHDASSGRVTFWHVGCRDRQRSTGPPRWATNRLPAGIRTAVV